MPLCSRATYISVCRRKSSNASTYPPWLAIAFRGGFSAACKNRPCKPCLSRRTIPALSIAIFLSVFPFFNQLNVRALDTKCLELLSKPL